MNEKQKKAREKLARKAARGPGFSNYPQRRLEELKVAKVKKEDAAEAKE